LGVNGKANVNAGTLRHWFVAAAASIHEQRDYLTQLDAAIGDADHGTNMDRGFTAVLEKLDSLEDVPPGKVLTTAGSTLVSTVGGARGPVAPSETPRSSTAPSS
jgi:dihydroxyacetone kinase-like protein